jgi:hypothetical protein
VIVEVKVFLDVEHAAGGQRFAGDNLFDGAQQRKPP